MQLVGLGAVVIADIGLGRAEVHLDTAVRGHWEPRKRCRAVPLRAPSARSRRARVDLPSAAEVDTGLFLPLLLVDRAGAGAMRI